MMRVVPVTAIASGLSSKKTAPHFDVGQIIDAISADTQTDQYLSRILDYLKQNKVLVPDAHGIPRGFSLRAPLFELLL